MIGTLVLLGLMSFLNGHNAPQKATYATDEHAIKITKESQLVSYLLYLIF